MKSRQPADIRRSRHARARVEAAGSGERSVDALVLSPAEVLYRANGIKVRLKAKVP